jgi:hypothetical protein
MEIVSFNNKSEDIGMTIRLKDACFCYSKKSIDQVHVDDFREIL